MMALNPWDSQTITAAQEDRIMALQMAMTDMFQKMNLIVALHEQLG